MLDVVGGRVRRISVAGRLASLAALISLALTGCTLSQAEQSGKRGPDVILGAPVSFTGNQAREGALARRGYDMWLEWVNQHGGIDVRGVHHRVQIRYEDDQSKPALAAQLTDKLIVQQKVQFLLGPYGSSTTAAAAPVAERHRMPMVEGNGAAEAIFSKGYRYVFGVLSPAAKYLQGVLDMAASQNPKPQTIALLTADDSFSLEVAKGVIDYAPTRGMQVVSYEQYPDGSTNVYGPLSRAQAQKPEIVLNSGHLVEAVAINKAALDLRFDAKVFAYSVGPSTPDFTAALGKDANYVFSGSQWTPAVRYRPSFYLTPAAYVADYRKRFKTQDDPDYHVAESTAAGLALQKGIENAGSLEPDRVRDALAALDLITFYGRIKFDGRGLNVFKPMLVEQIQQGQRQTVWPPELATGAAVYPTPSWTVRSGVPPLEAQPKAPSLPTTGKPPGSG